eukprot:CAMPEP_0204296150 /NCGR_PEP_ID=MMETSP0468-20130131/70959_1 /ASSEMBLY_ACC=CAM_ASM_000383 /TAXON_ID=2969 /ORGANISM="Oxyrrhis marina" /LENGTH=99 /DNA_ID=CAMNT_0051274823 /DNA_START=6 /DNA_END=305 /DNA_ORIENTATION=+
MEEVSLQDLLEEPEKHPEEEFHNSARRSVRSAVENLRGAAERTAQRAKGWRGVLDNATGVLMGVFAFLFPVGMAVDGRVPEGASGVDQYPQAAVDQPEF